MDNYPIEKQVCTLEQATQLAELLGEHAPESLWKWVSLRHPNGLKYFKLTLTSGGRFPRQFYTRIPAYTGDESGVLLLNSMSPGFKLPPLSEGRATLLITALKEGWIKPEEVKYG
jgi:hypothetical protein